MFKIGTKFYYQEHEAIIVIDGVCSDNPNMYRCQTYEIEDNAFVLTGGWIFSKSELESMISMEVIE